MSLNYSQIVVCRRITGISRAFLGSYPWMCAGVAEKYSVHFLTVFLTCVLNSNIYILALVVILLAHCLLLACASIRLIVCQSGVKVQLSDNGAPEYEGKKILPLRFMLPLIPFLVWTSMPRAYHYVPKYNGYKCRPYSVANRAFIVESARPAKKMQKKWKEMGQMRKRNLV